MGPDLYDGKHIREWQIDVCNVCLKASRDGLVHGPNQKLLDHLQMIGFPLQLNANGWIDWPDNSS